MRRGVQRLMILVIRTTDLSGKVKKAELAGQMLRRRFRGGDPRNIAVLGRGDRARRLVNGLGDKKGA